MIKKKAANVRIYKILIFIFLFTTMNSPFYLFKDSIEGMLDQFVFFPFAGVSIQKDMPYVYWVITAVLAVLFFCLIHWATKKSFTSKPSQASITICLKSTETNADSSIYLNSGDVVGATILPGFRSGKNVRKLMAVSYCLLALMPVLEGNLLVTAVLISLPFVIYGAQGLIHKERRKVDFKLKLGILVSFLLILSMSVYMLRLSIRSGEFRSVFLVSTVCLVPEGLQKLNIRVDEEFFYDIASRVANQDPIPYLKKGQLYEKRGNTAAAEANYKKAQSVKPEYYEPYYRLSRICTIKQDTEEALKMLEEAQRRNPQFAPAFYDAAVILLEKKNPEQANQMVDISLKLDNQQIPAFKLKGQIMAALGKYSEAVQYYSKAIRLNPKMAELYTGKSEILIAARRYDEALFNLERVLKLNPNDVQTYIMKGKALLGQNNYRDAIQSLEKALELNTADDVARAWLALASQEALDPVAALQGIEKALQKGSGIAELHFIHAYIQMESQQIEQALMAIDKAIQIDEEQAAYHAMKAELLLKKGDRYSAEGQIKTALEINSQNDLAQYALGRCLSAAGNYVKALEAFSQAQELNPYFARAYAAGAMTADLIKDNDRAETWLDTAIKLKPNDYFNYFVKSEIYFTQKRYMGALTAIQKAIELSKANHPELLAQKEKIVKAMNPSVPNLGVVQQIGH